MKQIYISLSTIFLFFQHIEAKLPATFSADVVITQQNIPFIITSPGVYQLAQDIVSTQTAIEIQSNNVILDLNGRMVSSSSVSIQSQGRSEVLIQNGFVNDGTVGINLISSVNFRITNIVFTANQTGISIDTGTESTIRDCIFCNHTSQALSINNCTTLEVTKCVAQSNQADNIFLLQNSSNVLFTNVEATNNTHNTTGFAAAFSGNSLSQSTFINCQAFQNTNLSTGFTGSFIFQSCQDILCEDCFSAQNSSSSIFAGFLFFSGISDRLTFKQCVANNNTSLTSTCAGFLLVGNTINVIECLADANTGVSGFGIFVSGANDSTIINNIVMSNTGSSSSTGIANSSSTTTPFGNISINHTNNFTGALPTVIYNTGTGTFAATPNVFSNINVQP